MSVDASDLAVIRSWCGSTVGGTHAIYTSADIEARMTRHGGDPLVVALEVLRQIRADFLADPASVTFTGDYAQDVAKNLDELDGLIRSLAQVTGDVSEPTVVTTAQITRRRRRR